MNNEEWSKGKDCIVATFISDDNLNTIYYDKKGNWFGSEKSYREDKMPNNIRRMISQEYYDYKISRVVEVEYVAFSESVLEPTYIVVIQKENDIKWIRIQNDTMDEYEDF